jgi:hypothetical protein
MGAATKADLEALVKRLERSLERSEARNMALGKSRDRAMAKNKALSKSVAEGREREQATAEILRVISRSSTDAQPVFDAIACAALRLIGGVSAAVTRLDCDMLHLAALTSTSKTRDERPPRHIPTLPVHARWLIRSIYSTAVVQRELLDHARRAYHDLRWHREPERFRGL